MKKQIYIFLLIIPFVISCEKIVPDLPRDNPLDSKSTNNNNNTGSPSLVYTKFIVTSDDNNNGIIEIGEHIKIKVFVKNTGSGIAKGVEANFTFENYNNVFFYGGTAYYGVITPSAENFGSLNTIDNYSIRFDLDFSILTGSTKKVNMLITDVNGGTWSDSFEFTVH